MLHPLSLAALAALLVNDHILKATMPGWLTGKLSDVAALVLIPLLAQALIELIRWRSSPADRTLWLAAFATAAFFAAMKTYAPAATVYRWAGGATLWLLHCAWSLGSLPPFRPAQLTPDLTDLFTLPAVLLGVWIGRRRRFRVAAGVATACLCFALTTPAHAGDQAAPASEPVVEPTGWSTIGSRTIGRDLGGRLGFGYGFDMLQNAYWSVEPSAVISLAPICDLDIGVRVFGALIPVGFGGQVGSRCVVVASRVVVLAAELELGAAAAWPGFATPLQITQSWFHLLPALTVGFALSEKWHLDLSAVPGVRVPLAYNTFHVFSPGGRITLGFGGRTSGFFTTIMAAPALNFTAAFRPAQAPFETLRGFQAWVVIGAQWRR